MVTQHNLHEKLLEAYDTYADAIFRYCYGRILDKEKSEQFVKETYCQAWELMNNGKGFLHSNLDFTREENIKVLLYNTADTIMAPVAKKKPKIPFKNILSRISFPMFVQRKKSNIF